MTKTTAISLSPGAGSAAALATVRSVVESRGYLWEPTAGATALAHQGGKPITRTSTATKLLLGVRVHDGQVDLVQQTTGAAGFVVNLGPLIAMRVRREFTRVRRAVEKALQSDRPAA